MKQNLHLILLLVLSLLSSVSYSQTTSGSGVTDTLLLQEWSHVEREYELRMEVLSDLQEYLAKKKSYKKLSAEIHDKLSQVKKELDELNGALLADRKAIAAVQNSLTPEVDKWLSVDLANDKGLDRDEEFRRIKAVSEGMQTRVAIGLNIYNKEALRIERSDLVLEGGKNLAVPQVEF